MKNVLDKKEVDLLLKELIDIRTKSTKSKSKALKIKYDNLQQLCAEKLDFLVENRARKYKAFANYEDLYQEGRLALFFSLKTYRPEKGDFFWWANKYIKTRISRAANCHSTIKIPLRLARHTQPYKVSQLPIMVDGKSSVPDSMIQSQMAAKVREAVAILPEPQRKVIELHFDMIDDGNCSIGKICEKLSITRSSCLKLLNDAKKVLRSELAELTT